MGWPSWAIRVGLSLGHRVGRAISQKLGALLDGCKVHAACQVSGCCGHALRRRQAAPRPDVHTPSPICLVHNQTPHKQMQGSSRPQLLTSISIWNWIPFKLDLSEHFYKRTVPVSICLAMYIIDQSFVLLISLAMCKGINKCHVHFLVLCWGSNLQTFTV